MASTVIITGPEREALYKRIRNLLGAPLRSVELEEEVYVELEVEVEV